MKKTLLLLLSLIILLSALTACGNEPGVDKPEAGTEHLSDDTVSSEPVTIRFFTINYDRSNGEGLVEQMIMDSYVAKNPHVTIEVEALENETYKLTFEAYAAEKDLPDILYVWGFDAFMAPLVSDGLLSGLNKDDYEGYSFSDASLAPFIYGDKLFGLPRSTDFYIVYYNKKIFEDYGLYIPETFEELMMLSADLRDEGIMPNAINGREAWGLAVLFNHLYIHYTADYGGERINNIITTRSERFADYPEFLEVARRLLLLAENDFFQDGYLASDYNEMVSLFTSGQTAMMYMGNWLTSLAFDESLSLEFRDNLSAFHLPAAIGDKGRSTDMAAFVGGGYSIAAHSPVKDEAIKFLNYMLEPSNWNRLIWENAGMISGQDMLPFVDENQLTGIQGNALEIMNSITNMTGQMYVEVGSPRFKTDAQDLILKLVSGIFTPEEFVTAMDEAADRSFEAMR